MSVRALPAWYRGDAGGPVGECAQGQVLVTVATETLVHLLDPLRADPWGAGPISPGQVASALSEDRLRAENPFWDHSRDSPDDATAHAERIAWLVRYGWDTVADTIEVEVDMYGGIVVHDGHHRLYALAFLGVNAPLPIAVTGYLDIAETLLGVTIL